MKIILDTNFLIYCAKNKLDYIEELSKIINEKYELVVPIQVIEELRKVTQKTKEKIPLKKRTARYKKTTGKDKASAELALQMLDKYIRENKVGKIKIKGSSVDRVIINLAKKNPKNIVCTLDREMRQTLGRVILINRFKKLILSK